MQIPRGLLVKLLPVLPAKAAALLLQVTPPLSNSGYVYIIFYVCI